MPIRRVVIYPTLKYVEFSGSTYLTNHPVYLVGEYTTTTTTLASTTTTSTTIEGTTTTSTTIAATSTTTTTLVPCYSYYQGGIVVYLDGEGGGLIAAPDIFDILAWDTNQDSTPILPEATYGAYGLGASNTSIIISTIGSSRAEAAQTCLDYSNDGYSDWFLPSVDELYYLTNANDGMWDCLYDNWYDPIVIQNWELWSSNDIDNRAIVYEVESGNTSYRFKNISPRAVVPCRYIT